MTDERVAEGDIQAATIDPTAARSNYARCSCGRVWQLVEAPGETFRCECGMLSIDCCRGTRVGP